jgi:endoglucanase
VVPVRLAESCDAADRTQASRMWSLISRSRDARAATALSLSGKVEDVTPSARSLVGAAGGAKAADDELQMHSLLDAADELERQHQTTEGAAWAALGRVMLTTNWLGDC